MEQNNYINILFPVYNEQLRLEKGIMQTLKFMEASYPGEYQLTVLDNASTDETQNISLRISKGYQQVKYIRIDKKGVGIAVREGIKNNACSIVGYMDVDLSTDINHLHDVMRIFKSDSNVMMINGSRLSRQSKTL